MNYKKYQDIAYLNRAGKQWLRAIHSPVLWEKWKTRLQQLQLTDREIEEYANAVIVEAAWHLGYARDMGVSWGTCERCASRLRRRGLVWVEKENRDIAAGKKRFVPEQDKFISGMPQEFLELEDFLEHEVRGTIPHVL